MKKILIVFLFLLVIAAVSDIGKAGVIKNGYIERDAVGGKEQDVELQLDIEQIGEDYTYPLEVLPMLPTKEEAVDYFVQVCGIIESDFAEVGMEVPLEEEYLGGIVKADWSFQPYGLINSDGTVYVEKLEEAETVIKAQVELSCGEYEEIYEFSFLLKQPQPTQEEQILQQVNDWMKNQLAIEGENELQLPTQIEGFSLQWSEKKEYITPQILVLEVISLLILGIYTKRKQHQDAQKQMEQMEWEYPDIVSQIALLLGAGMTTRQAWNRLAAQYRFKRNSKLLEENMVYEAILRMNRRLAEGETERAAYQKFSEEIPAPCYRKLTRILLGNLEMGVHGIGIRLEEESRQAFEHKILQAKKRGEEVSTKMLVPLMIMMAIVMGIVMLPALIQFQI